MNKDQWQQIEKIFYAAMEQPREERKAFVSQACAGDEDLLREVQALLEANQDAESFLDAPVQMPPHSGTFSPTLVMPHPATNAGAAVESGVRIGPYRLIREIGRGGMGAVWLAERDDGHFYQQVAIKLLHAGSENEEVIRRFRHERQILASLDHPNIARLLDGGTTVDGRPYFVMEYIEGLPIDEYCRQQQLSVDDRLRLFRQVCAAVHYAHQNLVIHRDLKPNNIAVTADGTPKLLDFGIAKLIQPDLSRSYDTLSGVTPMTPAYASPEQVRSEKLTTASDVYSLGVVLYELLTGRSPYRLKASAFGELIRAIIEQEPERPSTAITRADGTPPTNPITTEPTEKLRRRLSGDIDSIVLMALRKEAPLRYGSVEQFSEDLRRYLEGLPTLARRGTLGYRALKYIRRNKVPVAAAVLILLSLLGGIGATLRQARIAKAAQLQAEAEKSEAQSQRNRAETALTTAEDRRQQAESARNEADQQKTEAEVQRSFAKEQQMRAESQELSNRRLLYASQMKLAQTAWDESNVERVHELLTAHIPKPGEPDLRGFEWYYLWRLSHFEIASLPQAGVVKAIAFSPDERQLITLTGRGTIKLWNTSTWREQASLAGENLELLSFPAISPDRKRVASWMSSRREIGIWEVATGRMLMSFVPTSPSPETVISLAFSPDGKNLATGSNTGQIAIVRTDTGGELLSFLGHRFEVNSLTYSPDGARLVSSGWDRKIKLWDARTGKVLKDFNIVGTTAAIAYSPDGRLFATSGNSNDSVTIWDALTIKELKTVTFGAVSRSLVFSPDGKKLAVGSIDRQIRVWETTTWRELAVIKGHGNPVQALTFTSDGQKLVSGSNDGTVKVWHLGKEQTPLNYCGGEIATGNLAFTRDGSKLILACSSPTIRVSNIATGSEVYLLEGRSGIMEFSGKEIRISIAFPFLLTSNGKKLITSDENGFRFRDTNTGKELLRIGVGLHSTFALSSDERLLAAWRDGGGDVKVWDARTGNKLFDVHVDARKLNGMFFLPDNHTLVTGFDHLVFLDLRTRQEVKKVSLNGRMIVQMKLSPDGRTIALGFSNGLVGLYDSATGREKMLLKGHGDSTLSLDFSPDGKRLVSSSADSTIRFWDLTVGQEVFTFREPIPARSVAFSPDSRHLATVSINGFAKLLTAADAASFKASADKGKGSR